MFNIEKNPSSNIIMTKLIFCKNYSLKPLGTSEMNLIQIKFSNDNVKVSEIKWFLYENLLV